MNPRIGGAARSLIGLAAVMAALSSVAPAFSNRVSPVRNQPGERLLPKPRSRPKAIDFDKMTAAVDKMNRRRQRNLRSQASGGWASTQSWLNRLARIEAAKLQ